MNTESSEPLSIYHYTGLDEIRSILREGVLRASSMILWKSLFHLGDPSKIRRRTPPIVWFTADDEMERSVYDKFVGPGQVPFGRLFRIVLPHGYGGDLGLGEYSDTVGIPHEDWRWVVATGEMIGSDCGCWRVVPYDIPREDWQGIEVLIASFDDDLIWVPFDASGASIPDAVMREIDHPHREALNVNRLRGAKRPRKARRQERRQTTRRRR